jgi:aryl-alcohol dehydrogenase-like predicted oxidoreductase
VSSRLALGTAQFGLRYGVANTSGQVSRDEVAAILAFAQSQGLDTLDTAIAYGESERSLGEVGVGQWQIVTKLPAVPESGVDPTSWVRDSVAESLRRLRVPRLHGLLLHRSQDLLGPRADALYAALCALKQRGEVEQIGVSIYGPEELDVVWPRYTLDLVQAPFNVLDRRLETSGWLARLQRAGAEIHVRSIFLQGLLLMEPGNRPAGFARWQLLWERWHSWLSATSITALQACVAFALSRGEVGRVIVGVDGLGQLQQILASAAATISVPDALISEDLDLINPTRWSSW